MIQLPPMKIAQGEPFAYDFTVQGQDWTGWTGTATFKRSLKAVTGSKVSVTADAAGLIQIGLTAAQTAEFPALDRQGYFKQAVCEVSMTNGTDVQKYQARVLVAADA